VEHVLRVGVVVQTGWWALRRRALDERGEGVISTAVAVLIMALLGLAMWQVFSRVFTSAGEDIERNVNQIG
jgi:membrane-associated protease RseP (regulator of RpoE activity)